jgi:transcription termination factor Rho
MANQNQPRGDEFKDNENRQNRNPGMDKNRENDRGMNREGGQNGDPRQQGQQGGQGQQDGQRQQQGQGQQARQGQDRSGMDKGRDFDDDIEREGGRDRRQDLPGAGQAK